LMEPAVNRVTFPEIYERELVGPLFRPWAEILLDRARIRAGDRLLDVACGTGIVARCAKARMGEGGRFLGVDASPHMLAVARALAPEIDWREGKAESLPLAESEQFDVLVCQQGLQFVADKAAAMREMRRVLAAGGRVVIATWRPVEENPLILDLQRVAERRVGAIADQRHSAGEAGQVAGLLAEAGFQEIRVETLSLTTRLAEPSMFVRLNTMAIVRMSAAGAKLDEEQRGEVVAEIVRESMAVLPQYADGNGISFEMSSNVASAAAGVRGFRGEAT
jgi:ubiquinone/menaquinone biosynthesis C-methylase UbiE